MNPFSLVFQPAENRQGIFCILAGFLWCAQQRTCVYVVKVH